MSGAARRKAASGDKSAIDGDSKHLFVMTPLAAAVIAALSPASPALAQDDQQTAIEEIIVTATKRELNLQDVAQSIDVLSGQELARMGAKDLESTIKALPSVYLVALQPGQNSLVMRGISTGAYEYRTEAQVAVYLDEQPLTFNSQQVGVRNIDIERVESLPGPQGTLFGSSSQTGTIRYITNKPDSRGLAGQVELRYGTTEGGEDSYEVNGVVNIPIAEDVFAIRAVGYTSHDGGYVDNVFGTSLAGNYDNANLVEDNFNEYDVDGGRLHALWNVNDRWSVLATLLAENTTAEGVWDSDEALGDYKVTRFENEIRTDDWYSASLTLSGDLGFADLSFNYAKFDRDIVYEYDNMTYTQQKDRYWGGGLYSELYYAGDPNYVNYPNYALYNTDYYRGTIFNDQYQERDTFELRLVSKGESRLQWMVGGYYEDIFDHWFYGARIPGLTNTSAWAAAQAYAYFYSTPNYYNDYMPNPNQIYPLPPTDNNYSDELNRSVAQTAFFGELSYDLTEDLTIHGGMRWAEFDRDILEQWAFPQGLIPFGDIGSGGDGSYRDVGKQSDTIYKIGFRYSIDDDRMIYALYSQGFRVGGVNSQRAVQTGRLPQVYDGDFLHNYEVGIKSQWLDNRVTINASAFYMEWEDYMQSATFDQWWLNGTVNAGGAETKGIELQAEWRATDQLTLAANLFVADAEFQDNFCNDFVNNVNLGCVINANGEPVYTSLDSSGNEIQADIVAGMRMPNSPDTKVHASIYYTIPQVFGGNLWLYYDYYYSSDVWNNTANILENNTAGVSPAWSVSSFSAGLELDNQWDIELNIRNLFDDDGYSYVATWEAGYADMFGDPRYHRIRAQERPRTYWLTVRKGFGGT